MESELQKLRISKDQKAKGGGGSVWPWVVVVLLLGGGGYEAWQWQNKGMVVEVETLRVRRMEVASGSAGANDLVKLNATGYIMAAHEIALASKVVGRVAWIGVEMGDKIEKGQVLVRLEDDEYKARVTQEQGMLDNAKARLAELEAGSRPQEIAQMAAQLEQIKVELATAERNFARVKAVQSTLAVGKGEIDDAEALVQTRKAQVEAAAQQLELVKAGPRKEQIAAQKATVSQLEGALALAMVDFNNTVIKAPIASTILERNVEVGEFVTNGFVGDRGAKGYVVSIADLNDLLVDLDISQNDIAKISDKQQCWITTDAYPDKKYNGVVDLISPLANRQKATVQVRVKVLKPDGLLKPDMNATVAFLSDEKAAGMQGGVAAPAAVPMIRLPGGAVSKGGVFLVEDGKVVRRAVTVGMTAVNGDVEIKSGLSGGEDVILHPSETLHEGDKVKIQSTRH